jgi:hypothetical protein
VLGAGPLVVEVAGVRPTAQPELRSAPSTRDTMQPTSRPFFAPSAAEPPDWFTLTAALGAGVVAPSTDLVRVESGAAPWCACAARPTLSS